MLPENIRNFAPSIDVWRHPALHLHKSSSQLQALVKSLPFGD
jgi:hypothetical protein